MANYDNSTATISNCLIENTANGYAVLKYQLATISISDSDIISPLCGIYMCSTGGYVYLSGNTTVNGEEYDIYHDKGTISAKNKDQTVSLFTNDTITIKFYEPKSSGVRLIFNVEETNKDVFSLILTDDDKAKVDSLIYDSTNKRLVTHQHTFENGTCQETTCGQKLTGKDSSGLFYVNGVLANGIYENVYYENGLLFTGTTNGIYYVDGYPANGVYDNLYYENGVISTGTYDGKYYVDGVLAQGEIGDNYYIDGVLHTHTYDSDNGHTCSCGWHKHDTEIYKVFDGSTLTLTSGNYYLAENISLTSYNQTLTIGKSATVNFCLNGHTITFGTNAENKFSVVQYATLNLCDCQKTGKIIGNVVGAVISTYGTTTISDVEIINQNTANNIKNSAITNGGVLTIQSGKITGSGKWGIYNFKTVNIAGGEISAPYAVYNGQIMCNTYIYGSPTISGTYANIYVYCGTTSDPNYYYLTNEDGTKAYEGGSLSVGVVNDDYASTLGREIIKNVSETQKDLFSLTEENEYKLVYFEQSLYMHKHVFDSTWTTDSSVHYHACQVAYCDIENYSLYADANYSEHSFDNDCDATCNICSYEREITHTGSPTKYVCNNDGTHNVVYTCCGAVYVENEQCTIKYDDKDCTTADYCFCGYVISPAKQHTFDNDCDENCNNTGCNYTREISHEPNDDDNDCTTEVVCKICGTITTPAQSQHNFVYNTSEYLITRNCSNANCQHSESATLNLQSEYVYDKNVDVKDTIKVNYLDNWTGDKFSLTFKKDGAVVSTCINAGSYEISLKLSDTELGFGFIIQKANYDLSNISFESKTLTYDGQKHSLKISGELPSGVSVEYSKTDMCDVNTYDVIAYFFGDTENYNEIECKNALLEIQKAQLKITANDDTITYGDEPKSNGATFSGFVQDENESYLLGELQYTFSYQKYANVGEYSIIITGYESNNYEIEYIQGKLIVSPKDISFANVMFEDNLTYNKSVQTLQVTSVQIDGLYATFSVSGNQGTNAGDYTLVVTGTGNYVGTVEKLWHIQQAVVQIPNSQQNLVYDGSEKVGVLETEFYTVENGKGVLAGDYHATVTLKDENNYRWNATFAEIIWSIQKAEPVVPTAPIIERELIYGQQLCEIQPSDGWLFMDVDRYKSPKVNESQNLFKMRYKVDTDNYNWENFVNNDMYAYENGYCYTYVKVTIKKASYYMHDVIFEDKTFVEDGQMKELAISGNLPKGVSVTYVNNGQSQVGEYVVIAKFTGDSENYNAIKDMTAKITINRASLTQTLDNEGDGTLEVIITKNGGIAPNIQLVIKKQNTISETIKKAIEKTEQVSFIYDIKLQNGDESVQPDGEITIKLSILSELNNKTFRLLHIHNNSVEQLKYEVQDGYAVFTVENLSEFAFITDAPKSTFSLNWLFLIIPIGLIFMLGVYVVIKKKLFIKR